MGWVILLLSSECGNEPFWDSLLDTKQQLPVGCFPSTKPMSHSLHLSHQSQVGAGADLRAGVPGLGEFAAAHQVLAAEPGAFRGAAGETGRREGRAPEAPGK